MKRQFIVMGMFLLMSGTTVWAQSPQAREAETARVATERAKAAIEVAQARVNEKQAELQKLTVQTPVTPRAPAPIITNSVIDLGPNFGQNQLRLYTTSRSADPLSMLQIAPGTWWNNADAVSALSLTKEQQRKMDDIFQQHRLKLIDLNAALSKEEAILDPLMAAEKLDEPKILTQIDRIAQARAELEKANSRMLLGIRQTLTMEQWTKVQDSSSARWRRR
ncbi:MAG TPA: Spy/CpxP family protein refolding chaperone [Terriglobia bacterium]|nr:Spy/CpxP family protein refolding chaperone [Terriglobia bacterium]